jgi:prevent-host-death family protein
VDDLLISDFKARCVEILNAVHDGGNAVIVTRRGKPLVRVVPLTNGRPTVRNLGTMAGEAVECGDIVHTEFDRDWESAQ